MFPRIPNPAGQDATSSTDDTINLTTDADWWSNAIEEDTFNSPLPFDASENGLWNGKFVPPPPRPPFLEESISSDGLTTCDLCTWAWHEKNAYSLDGSIGKSPFNCNKQGDFSFFSYQTVVIFDESMFSVSSVFHFFIRKYIN